MTELLAQGLFWPALGLGLLGFVVPRILALALPEGVGPLMLNGVLSTLVVWVLSAGVFLCLYLWQGAPLEALAGAGVLPMLGYFGRLGLAAALIWAPIMLLSVAGLPRKWVKETW